MTRLMIFAFLLFALNSCGNKREGKAEMLKERAKRSVEADVQEFRRMPAQKMKAKMASAADDQLTVSKKIVKEGDITFETDHIAETRKNIYQSLQKLGGYVAEDNQALSSENGRKEYELKIQVPASNFERFLNDLVARAYKIDSQSISVKDVTTQFIDVSAQLENKKKLEIRYLDLLKKANKMTDLLAIEDKLSEIRTDIESTQSQLNYLTKQVEYSSLDITFYGKQAAQENGATFGTKIMSAFSDGLDMLSVLFFALIGLWPMWIILVTAYLIFRGWRKKREIKSA